MWRVRSSWGDGDGQQGVFAVGLAPVFFKHGPVFCYGCPDSTAGVIGHAGWDLGNMSWFDVDWEFWIHNAGRREDGRVVFNRDWYV